MSVKGVTKALYRTPHQLFGQRTAEDSVFRQWEHDLKSAVAGLEYLMTENNKWNKFWVKFVTNIINVINIFKDLHLKLETRRNGAGIKPDKREMFNNFTIYELEQASKLAKSLSNRVIQLSELSTNSFNRQCNEMILNLKQVQKLITKRNHKKIDYDMQIKRLNKAAKSVSSAFNEDNSKLYSEEQNYTDSLIIFQDLNEKVKLIVPEILSSLSEFLNKLSYKMYFSNVDIINLIQKHLSKFGRVQGLVPDPAISTYDNILEEFVRFNGEAQNKLENLLLLKEFTKFRNQNMSEKAVHHVNSAAGAVVGGTMNLTSNLYTKASKPNQKLSLSLSERPLSIENPVKSFDAKGMFSSALDPIEFTLKRDQFSAMDVTPSLPFRNSAESKREVREEIEDNELRHSSSLFNNDDGKWMKPMKIHGPSPNEAKIEENDYLTPLIPTVDSSTRISIDAPSSSFKSKTLSDANVTSLPNLDMNTETYKYIQVSSSDLIQRIAILVTTPEINSVPVTVTQSRLGVNNCKLKDYIVAQTSITAAIFREYNNAQKV